MRSPRFTRGLITITMTAAFLSAGSNYAGAEASGHITGVVTSSTTGEPIDGISVLVYTAGYHFLGWGFARTTDSNGRYSIDNLPDETYYLSFLDQRYPSRYAGGWYLMGTDQESATPIPLSGGETQTADMLLDPAAFIKGRVTDSNGVPIANIMATASVAQFGSGRFGVSDQNGNFTIWGLRPGTYKVAFDDNRFPQIYTRVWYRDATSFASATPVTVEAGQTIDGIDQSVQTPGGCENDSDNDGLGSCEEIQAGTDRTKPDTDGDGLTDGQEVHTYLTDPLRVDTDSDGLTDGQEVNTYHTNPLVSDTDGDGLNDRVEVNYYRTDPTKSDTDGDSLSDREEIYTYGTDPRKADTDGDSLLDAEEINTHHTDPRASDTDSDRVGDGDEIRTFKTNPLWTDTDGDAFGDGFELFGGTCSGVTFKGGSDPNDATSTPAFGTNLSHSAVSIPVNKASLCV